MAKPLLKYVRHVCAPSAPLANCRFACWETLGSVPRASMRTPDGEVLRGVRGAEGQTFL
jgi:hypothetical protein